MLGDERLEPPGALLLGALDHHLDVHRDLVAESAQRHQVHDDVALAVGRPAAIPAIVDLGQAEGRGAPCLFDQWGLHVVVGVQQHRGGVRVAARP